MSDVGGHQPFATEGTEGRCDDRRREAFVQARLRALDQAHPMLMVGAEYVRASAVGEPGEQIASLPRQTETFNYLEAFPLRDWLCLEPDHEGMRKVGSGLYATRDALPLIADGRGDETDPRKLHLS